MRKDQYYAIIITIIIIISLLLIFLHFYYIYYNGSKVAVVVDKIEPNINKISIALCDPILNVNILSAPEAAKALCRQLE